MAVVAALFVGAVAVTYVSSWMFEPRSEPSTRPARSVVIFGVPRLGLSDLGTGTMPTLDRLTREGATAAMSVRTVSPRPSTAEAYATLSAGTRVRASSAASDALPPTAPVEGSSAREVAERRTGAVAEGEVIVVGAAEAISEAEGASSPPGALGDVLGGAGLGTAVVSNADIRTRDGITTVRRPAAVAAMDSAGAVDLGVVDDTLLRATPEAPYGVAVDPVTFASRAERVMGEASLTVLDPGETDRADSYAAVVGLDRGEEMRVAALRRTDAVLAEVMAALPEDALLFVLGVTPPTAEWELTPAVAYGAGVVPGQLASSSTRREGLIPLTDVTATAIDTLGLEGRGGMVGRPLRYRAEPVDIATLERANDVAAGRERVYFPMALTFIVAQALVYIFAIIALTIADLSGRFVSTIRVLVLAFAAWPLATFLVRMVPVAMTWGAGTHILTWGVALAVTALALRARGHPLAPLAAITTATLALLVVDVATGAHLQSASILGYSPHTSGRYTGFGNTAYAVLSACAIVTAVVMVDRRRTRLAVVAAAALLAFVVVVDGAPWLGSDVGGILSLVPTYGLVIYALSGRRLSWRVVGIATVATVVVLGIALGLDLLQPPEARTHLARFVADTGEDGSTFWDTVERKWATNVRIFTQSIWTWMIPIIASFSIYVLVIARGWRRLLPIGSPLRVGALGAITAGVLGWLVNDSGVVITALVFVYLGPYLTLIAIGSRPKGSNTLDLSEVASDPLPSPR